MREAFGQKIENHSLHQKSLRELEIAYQSNTMLAFFLARILGKEDCNLASETEKSLLRVLTPIAKLYTAKQSIKYASEHIEMFGGIGYLEDSGIPAMLRDAQVLSIWEGTTNVLSLDMLRAIEKENGLNAFVEFSHDLLSKIDKPSLTGQKGKVQEKLSTLLQFAQSLESKQAMMAVSRDIAFYIAETAIALLWLDFIQNHSEKEEYISALDYWLHFKMDEKTFESAEYLGTRSRQMKSI
jgi:hypothetical protein